MKKKGMDFIVFNDVTLMGAGFGTDTNRVCIIDKSSIKDLPLMSKELCAEEILNHYLEVCNDKKCHDN